MTKSILSAAALGLALSGALSALADEPSTSTTPAAKPYPKGITCAYVPISSGYGVIDDKHLIVDGIGKQKYLVTLFTRCFNLSTAFAIRFDRRGSDLCTGDAIVAGRDRCLIQFVEEVASAKEGQDLVKARDAAESERSKAH
jgi:hypothetical protein